MPLGPLPDIRAPWTLQVFCWTLGVVQLCSCSRDPAKFFVEWLKLQTFLKDETETLKYHLSFSLHGLDLKFWVFILQGIYSNLSPLHLKKLESMKEILQNAPKKGPGIWFENQGDVLACWHYPGGKPHHGCGSSVREVGDIDWLSRRFHRLILFSPGRSIAPI